MNDSSRIALAACIGASVGAIPGFLYLTERGYRLRVQIEPRLDDFMSEITRLRGTVEKARAVADEGWRSLSDLAGTPKWEGGSRVSH
jgi:hypothetical protein